MFSHKKKERQMAMLQNVNPTSKASLKRQCIMIAEGDLKKAKEFYDFWAEGMEDELPTFDPKEPSWADTFGMRVNSVLDWAQEHKDVLNQGADFITSFIGRRTPAIGAAESLEEINE